MRGLQGKVAIGRANWRTRHRGCVIAPKTGAIVFDRQDFTAGISVRPPSDVRKPHTAAAAITATITHELCPYHAEKSVVNSISSGVSMANSMNTVANNPKR